MKSFLKMILVITIAGTTFTACEKSSNDPSTPASPNGDGVNLSKDQIAYVAQEYQRQIGDMNNGNGAFFLNQLQSGNGITIIRNVVFDPVLGITAGQAGGFSADYDANDFFRSNPDGTYTLHMSSNTADGNYQDFGLGTYYEGLGMGNLTINYTGTIDTIQVPFPPFELYFLNSGARGSVNFNGTGKVTLDGLPGPEYQLKVKITQSAGKGNGTLNMELK